MKKATIAKTTSLAVSLGALLCLGLPSNAQAGDYRLRSGSFQVGGSLGFTASIADQTAFALGAEFAYYITDAISIRPRFSFNFDNDFFLFLAMADARYTFDIKNPKVERLKPFVGLGVGAGVIDADGPDNTDAAFVFGLPTGVEYFITQGFSLGTEFDFLFPVGFGDDHFFFQWQVVTARYLF